MLELLSLLLCFLLWRMQSNAYTNIRHLYTIYTYIYTKMCALVEWVRGSFPKHDILLWSSYKNSYLMPGTHFFSFFYDPHNRWFIVRPLFDLDRTEWFACVFPCRYTHRVFRSGDERSTSILLGFLVECNSEAEIYFAHRHTYTYSLMHPGTGDRANRKIIDLNEFRWN